MTWFVYDSYMNEYEEFDTKEQAILAAKDFLRTYETPTDAIYIKVGFITHKAIAVGQDCQLQPVEPAGGGGKT